jgi:DNA-binding Lrp family transcriptional regulator
MLGSFKRLGNQLWLLASLDNKIVVKKRKKPSAMPFFYENEKRKIIPLDDIDVDIIKKMLDDADLLNSAISNNMGITEIDAADRRKIIENKFLTKNYLLDISALGWHIGDINIDVGKGKSERMAKQIFTMFPNILEISLRIDSVTTVTARVFYKDNQELASIMDRIKELPNIRTVEFSEIIKIVRTRSIGTMREVFTDISEH